MCQFTNSCVLFPFWDPVYFTLLCIQNTMFSEVLLSWWIYSSHVLSHFSYFYCQKTETQDRSLFSKIRCRYSICSCFDVLVTGKWQFWILELDFFSQKSCQLHYCPNTVIKNRIILPVSVLILWLSLIPNNCSSPLNSLLQGSISSVNFLGWRKPASSGQNERLLKKNNKISNILSCTIRW